MQVRLYWPAGVDAGGAETRLVKAVLRPAPAGSAWLQLVVLPSSATSDQRHGAIRCNWLPGLNSPTQGQLSSCDSAWVLGGSNAVHGPDTNTPVQAPSWCLAAGLNGRPSQPCGLQVRKLTVSQGLSCCKVNELAPVVTHAHRLWCMILPSGN